MRMRWIIRLLLGIWALCLIAVAIPAVAFLVTLVWPIYRDIERVNADKERLLHATDHAAVLAACRELMRAHAGPHRVLSGDNPLLPEPIRSLHASDVSVDSDFVSIEMHGGFAHYGFRAFAEGVENHDCGDAVKLLDGLWFYGPG
jgi:hypothetical protein